ncbi:MAG: TonB-dependent receptor, partial [Bacteroidetes bacterium SW_10_40_5]
MFKQIIPFILFIILISSKIYAQGISTGSISGQINNQEEEPLVDANVTAIHQPTMTEYNTISRNNGRYNLPNLKIGGPYTLKFSYVGYQKVVRDSIYVDLGQNRLISVEMLEKADQMQEVEVVGQKDPYEDASAGINTNISKDDLNNLPSLDRSFKEFTRLTPQKGEGLSFAGRNNFYNNLTVDGSLLNNSFGLSPLPGGQTNAQPLSLDAIQSVKVALTPYNVTQSGFTGSGINLVTRSGTNQFKGSVYSYFRSANLVGNKVDDTELETKDFNRRQYGFRAGGPIVED